MLLDNVPLLQAGWHVIFRLLCKSNFSDLSKDVERCTTTNHAAAHLSDSLLYNCPALTGMSTTPTSIMIRTNRRPATVMSEGHQQTDQHKIAQVE
jgi:hypothetical protein